MILDYLTQGRTLLDVEAHTAQQAIEIAVRPLVEDGSVTEQYLQDVLASFEQDGPFCVLAPGFAVPHSQPHGTVMRSAITFVRLAQPIPFGHTGYDPVRFVIALAGVDQNAHILLLQQLIPVLASPELAQQLEQVADYAQLEELLRSI